ncbi:MAG: YeiH family protein [Alphaproteobacteria bacterium]|jgi:uncharacterized integral membrane protein (TIGR00698 family)|nr:YeiH family protein [Alphaproteobacteria bacterium]
MVRWFIVFKNIYKGILFSLLISLMSIFLANIFFDNLHISSLTIAIIIGMIVGNLFDKPITKYISHKYHDGLAFSQKRLLRLGIIFYGFRITFQEILNVGIIPLLIDLFVIISIIIIGYNLGTRIFKLNDKLATLISAGSAICGAAAVLALNGAIKAKNHEVAIAIATVVIFGTIAMFTFPYIIMFLNLSDYYMGVALGATVHEVAQVVAAGDMINENVTAIAIIVKLTRVMLLLPVIVVISIFFSKKYNYEYSKKDDKSTTSIVLETFPWFVIGFIIMSGLNSLDIIPSTAINAINTLDNLLLTMAMAALGIGTNFVKIKNVGFKPFILAGILMIVLISYLGLASYIF